MKLNVVMLNVIMLNAMTLNDVLLNVIILNVIMLNVIMLNVVAPPKGLIDVEASRNTKFFRHQSKVCHAHRHERKRPPRP